MAKEQLPDFFGRFQESQFNTYSEKYKDILKMTRRNGVLEVQMHTNGGPLQFGWKIHSAWSHAWLDIGQDHENEVIILTGTGDRWLIGNPEIWKTRFVDWTPDAKLKMRMEAQKLLENLVFGIDVPIIAAINGPGTHCEIGTLCDITLVTEDVDFFDPHFLAGVPPGDGMALTLQRLMGTKRASYYAYTGKNINGKTAVELGIANEVLPREKLLPRARELAEMMMERPRAARVMTHGILMRPWKQALVEDQGFHGTSISFANCLDEEGVWTRLNRIRDRF